MKRIKLQKDECTHFKVCQSIRGLIVALSQEIRQREKEGWKTINRLYGDGDNFLGASIEFSADKEDEVYLVLPCWKDEEKGKKSKKGAKGNSSEPQTI